MTQNEALAIMESGHSVLLTGAAGAGKTYLLNKYIRRARNDGKNVAVTATTGLAATHLNGTTIHAWSGIGVQDSLDRSFFNKISRQRLDIITNTDVLVIDEISMFHDFRLDMVEEVCRNIRGGDKPFGGLQVILCGDFFQLPPVNRRDSRQGGFITSSSTWIAGSFLVCYLEEQFRQSEDEIYGSILNGIRVGQLTRNQLNLLQARNNAVADPFTPRTKLMTTNVDVDAINQVHLNELDEEEYEYEMGVTGSKKYVETLKKSCLAPESLKLKRGAIVMCIKNSQDRKYSNGSLGKVVDFEPDSDFPLIKLASGREVTIKPETWELVDGDKRRATITQIPLRLAWAITVHKSQGMTLDSAQVDLSNAFVEGMGYVALSRIRTLQDLILDGMNGMALRTSALARQLDSELRENSILAFENNRKTIDDWKAKEEKVKEQTLYDSSTDEPSKPQWSDRLKEMRKNYPNAYKPWSETEDEKLIRLFAADNTTEQLSKLMGRHPGSIKARLKKHFGEDMIWKP